MLARLELALAGVCRLGGGHHLSGAPRFQVCALHLGSGVVVQARLEDRHLDVLHVVEDSELGECAQGVQAQLRVALSLHLDALAVLQINNVQGVIRDHDAVSRTEAARDQVTEVHHLLDCHLGRGESLSRVENKLDIGVSALFHFRVVGGLGSGAAFQGRAELGLGHGVRLGALQGRLAHCRSSWDGGLQRRGGCALQPAVSAGGGEPRVDLRH